MLYLPDTNACVRFLRNDPRVVAAWARSGPHLRLSVIVVAELQHGAAKSSNPRHREQLDDLVATLPVEPFTLDDTLEYSRLRLVLEKKGLPIGPFDLLIAAQALRLGAVLVTHNAREFSRDPGLRCEDWQAA